MNFSFTDEQIQFRKLVNKFTQKEIAPFEANMDRNNKIDINILDKMKSLNFWGLPAPSQFGGSFCDAVMLAICFEELAKGSSGIAVTLDGHFLCLEAILLYGNEDQKSKYLPSLCSGNSIGAFAWTEPSAGSDAGAIQTFAKKTGDSYVLNGSKCFITNSGIAQIYVVGAVTNPKLGAKGFSLFIVNDNTKGLEAGKAYEKLGVRGSQTADLYLDNVLVDKNNLIGAEGEGFKQAMNIFNSGRIWVSASGVGLAQAALNEAVKYSKERITFGKPLTEQQAIQFMISDMDTEIQAARFLTLYAAYLKSIGKPHHKEAAQAKYFSSETVMKTAKNSLQIFGGYGLLTDYPIERFYRDAKFFEIGEGTSEILKTLVCKSILNNSNT
jgi:alkylation response protein AidB-like acyl-CoA dehydrogenase